MDKASEVLENVDKPIHSIEQILLSLQTDQKLIDVAVDPEIIHIWLTITKYSSNNLIQAIELTVLRILKDGRINFADVPEIIFLIQQLHDLIIPLKDLKIDSAKAVADLLKLIIYVLVNEGRTPIETAKQSDFLSAINSLIDTSTQLIRLPLRLPKPAKKCCMC